MSPTKRPAEHLLFIIYGDKEKCRVEVGRIQRQRRCPCYECNQNGLTWAIDDIESDFLNGADSGIILALEWTSWMKKYTEARIRSVIPRYVIDFKEC